MPPKANPATAVVADDADTQPLGDRSPKFRKLSDDEKLNALLAEASPTMAALPDHALDLAAENSKVILVPRIEVAGRMAVLATPDGPVELPKGDPAHLLPIGSKVYKTPHGYFAAVLPEEYAQYTPAPGQFVRAAELFAHINNGIAGNS